MDLLVMQLSPASYCFVPLRSNILLSAVAYSSLNYGVGRAIAQEISRRLPTAAARVRARSGHVAFVADKVALGQVFSVYLGFPCQFSFHRLFHIYHPLSCGTGTIWQLVADLPSGLSLTPPKETKKKTNYGVSSTDSASWIGAIIGQ
jgi:hypothetical protein